MKTQKISFNYKNKKINLEVSKCNLFGKGIGLMFSCREKSRALLFQFEKPTRMPIHSFFVFYPFLAIWLDSDGKVVEKKLVRSWRVSVRPKEKFSFLIEIPLNQCYSNFIKDVMK
jgi:uncharacterized membrane protein (UPF0127 family)